ncbi:MAG: DUF1844 domain-containing protein [Planctomycetota bacterium]
MPDADDAPKIQIDSDWKAQAQAEKKKLAEQSRPAEGGAADPRSGGPGEIPPANFETLLSSFVTQALFAMGAIPDPQTGQPVVHLDLARYQIDMLAVLEEKTRNNLTDDESQMLAGTLYELRSRYVQAASAGAGPSPA